MALKQAVTTHFKGRDEQSKIFNKMGKSADKFGEKGSRAFKKMSRSATKASTIMKGVLGAQVVGKGIGLLSRGVQSVTTDFLNFDNAVLSASAKFKGLDLSTQKGIDTLERLKKSARTVGAETEFNAAQAAQGLDFLALAGFNADQAMALLPGVTNLATVAQVDLATATDIASDSLGAFGLATKNTEQLTKNFTRVQDVMAKTTATSNTNLTDLFEAVKKGAPDFTAAGQSIETFSALVGTMANSGIKGAEAGTKLRNIAVRLTGGSKEAAEAIQKMGIRVADGSGNFRDMLDIIDDVIKGTSKMGEVQKAAALKTIFGARQTGGLNVILKEGTKRLRAYRQMLIDSKGAAEKMASVMRSSLINRLKSLGSAATEVGFQLFSAFDEQGADAIDALTQAVRRVDLAPMIKGIKSLAADGKRLFDRLVEIGNETGLFDKVKTAIDKAKPAFSSMFDIIKTIWSFLDKSGTIATLALTLGAVADASGAVAENFTKMWNVIKPILEKMDKMLPQGMTIKDIDPFAGQKNLLKPIAKAFDIGSTAFRAVFDPTFDPLAGEKSAPNPRRAAPPPQQQVGFNGTLNINGAPQGSTFEQDSGSTPISVTGLE